MATKSKTGKGGAQAPVKEKERGGQSGGQRPARRPEEARPAATALPKEVVVDTSITVRDLATLMQRSPIDLIKILMQYGIMAPITHTIDHDTAVILGEELGVAVKWPPSENDEEEEVVEEKAGAGEAPKSRTRIQQVMAEQEDRPARGSPAGGRRARSCRPWQDHAARPHSSYRCGQPARQAASRSAPAPIR